MSWRVEGGTWRGKEEDEGWRVGVEGGGVEGGGGGGGGRGRMNDGGWRWRVKGEVGG